MTQFYDQVFAPIGLRATQYAILSRLRARRADVDQCARRGAGDGPHDVGRNILPLERDGLIEIAPSTEDRRRRDLRLTEAGLARQRAGGNRWAEAQSRFEAAFGRKRAAKMRSLMREISECDFSDAAD